MCQLSVKYSGDVVTLCYMNIYKRLSQGTIQRCQQFKMVWSGTQVILTLNGGMNFVGQVNHCLLLLFPFLINLTQNNNQSSAPQQFILPTRVLMLGSSDLIRSPADSRPQETGTEQRNLMSWFLLSRSCCLALLFHGLHFYSDILVLWVLFAFALD